MESIYPCRILPPLLLLVLFMEFRLLLSVRSNLLHSDLPLRDVMRSKAKVNQEKKHENIFNMQYPTFSTRLMIYHHYCRNAMVCCRWHIFQSAHSCFACVYSQIATQINTKTYRQRRGSGRFSKCSFFSS